MKTNTGTIAQQEGNVVNIGGQKFGVVDEFVYLGALIRADGDNSAEIHRRIMAANRCFFGLQRHLRSKLLSKQTKCSIYKTLIRPMLLYGSESWPTTKTKENLILAFERKVLRAIFGPVIENGRFRRRYNFELERDFADVNVVTCVKVNRLRWAGHLTRMSEARAPIKLFNSEPAGRRGVGRPKNRWIDNITADLKKLGVRNWRTSAQDRQGWNRILDQAKSSKWM